MKIKQARNTIDHRLPDFIICCRKFWGKRRWIYGMLLMESCTYIRYKSRNDVEKSVMTSLQAALLTRNVGQLEIVLVNWNKMREGK
jgi:hypothetical protein